jgi:hypothetical protein
MTSYHVVVTNQATLLGQTVIGRRVADAPVRLARIFHEAPHMRA